MDGYNRRKVAAPRQCLCNSTLQADTQGGTLSHRRLRISLSFHKYHFFEGVAVKDLRIKQQRLNAIKLHSN